MGETCVEILMWHDDSNAVRPNDADAVSSDDMIDLFLEFPALFANLSPILPRLLWRRRPWCS